MPARPKKDHVSLLISLITMPLRKIAYTVCTLCTQSSVHLKNTWDHSLLRYCADLTPSTVLHLQEVLHVLGLSQLVCQIWTPDQDNSDCRSMWWSVPGRPGVVMLSCDMNYKQLIHISWHCVRVNTCVDRVEKQERFREGRRETELIPYLFYLRHCTINTP